MVMGLRSVLTRRVETTHHLVTAAAADPVEPTPRPGGPWPDPMVKAIAEAKLSVWLGATMESLPPVRRAVRVICGTVGGWTLKGWRDGRQLEPSVIPWLAQPDPARTSQDILSWTLHDGIWHDRSVWREVPGGWRRVSPSRVLDAPADDPDDPPRVLIDGAAPRDRLVVFRFGGAGGLRTLAIPLVSLLGDVFAAASRYAASPAPEVILKNTGVDIADADIDALLTRWDTNRAAHTAGYLGAYLDAVKVGYSAKDLQLIEAMDELAKDVARLFGLPAPTLGVSAGDSLTYSTTIEQRRDLLEALRPWSTGIEQTLSMGTYAVNLTASGVSATRAGAFVPWGTLVRFDTADFEREPWSSRLDTLGRAIAATGPDGSPLLAVEEARALEPSITAVRP